VEEKNKVSCWGDRSRENSGTGTGRFRYYHIHGDGTTHDGTFKIENFSEKTGKGKGMRKRYSVVCTDCGEIMGEENISYKK